MSEQPVGEQASPHRESEYPIFPPPQVTWKPPTPRVVVKRDLLPAISILSTVALLGLAVGWLWSRLAPPQRKVITQDGQAASLTDESYHRFDDLVIFMLLCLAAGIVAGVAVWYLRERRGPVVMLAAVAGGALGGWLAMAVGRAWADGRWPMPKSVKPLDIVSVSPVLESSWGLLLWPLMTALAYGVLAAMNGMDDLGRRLG
ncbi:DUF2567 domain-containing protein [Actinophytocola oryzae]|uniref:Uncharacterized protein DUF2567 n=1 Tax=Actinophytocola oryzae TaxID=502181 RepID=A0A4R7VBF3_9PSEU|nr:DUF2567 domain-containing protein [Actinophytocola oryzae]TDV46258.1 uncharacterized protein DUF2567 [Actinophytocola oryzae]